MPLTRETNALDLLRRPELDYDKLMQVPALGPAVQELKSPSRCRSRRSIPAIWIDRTMKSNASAATRKPESPQRSTYAAVRGLSAEVMQKLARSRPQTIGQAQRISGVTPAAISLLLVHLRRRAA